MKHFILIVLALLTLLPLIAQVAEKPAEDRIVGISAT